MSAELFACLTFLAILAHSAAASKEEEAYYEKIYNDRKALFDKRLEDEYHLSSHEIFETIQLGFYSKNKNPNIISYGIPQFRWRLPENFRPENISSLYAVNDSVCFLDFSFWTPVNTPIETKISFSTFNDEDEEKIKLEVKSTEDLLREFYIDPDSDTPEPINMTACSESPQGPSFFLVFYCKSNGSFLIKGRIGLDDSTYSEFYFVKNCTIRSDPHIDMKIFTKERKLIRQNIGGHFNESDFKNVTLDDNEAEIEFKNSHYGNNIVFSPKLEKYDNESLKVELIDKYAHGGKVDSVKGIKMRIFITCKKKTKHMQSFDFTANLHPFGPIRINFLFNCDEWIYEHSLKYNLTDVFNKSAIITNGIVNKEYIIKEEEMHYWGNYLAEVHADIKAGKFDFSYRGSGELSLETSASTNSLVLDPYFSKQEKYAAKDSDLKNISFFMFFNCKTNGRAVVKISLIQNKSSLESFWIVKNCLIHDELTSAKPSSFWTYLVYLTLFYFCYRVVKHFKSTLAKDSSLQSVKLKYEKVEEIPRAEIIFHK